MRLSGLSGLCAMVMACQVVFACGDGDDPMDISAGGSDGSSAGEGGEPSRGGSSGSGNQAGESVGGHADGGTGGVDTEMGGMGGVDTEMGGTGSTPECTKKADCDDDNPCTDDACVQGECQNTNNTADCDDLSACTAQDKCEDGACVGSVDTSVCPACDVPNNLIQNCDFSDELTSWAPAIAFQGAEATQTVVNGRNVIDITAGGEAIYAVQPRQEPLTLKQGMSYRLRIVAGASVDRDIVMALTQAAGDYKVYTQGDNVAGGFTLALEREMKPFEFEFTMLDPDDSNVKLEIKMGGDDGVPGVVYFDDVVVEELPCTSSATCNDDNPCTADVCDVGEGTCSWTATTDVCTDDGDPCTLDQCQAGACTHTFDTLTCDCSTDTHCDDNNPCTDDQCSAGTCENTPNTASCNDNDLCTTGDVCSEGVCGGTNVCIDCAAGGNLLTNCDFSGGQTGWEPGFFGGTGTQSVVDGRLVVNITDGGTANWQVQPKQTGLALVQNTTYVVKFNAMASVARTVDVSITQDGGAYATYSGVKTFSLTSAMKAFTFEFTMTSPPPTEPVRFELNLGGTDQNATVPNTVTFDNMFIAPKP